MLAVDRHSQSLLDLFAPYFLDALGYPVNGGRYVGGSAGKTGKPHASLQAAAAPTIHDM